MTKATVLIRGPNILHGEIAISGAKNAALPALAAVLLSDRPFTLSNVPRVQDIQAMLDALAEAGAAYSFANNQVHIQVAQVTGGEIKSEPIKATRAAILLLGPLLARNGYARVCLPGGCSIGERKIDFHVEALRLMGAQIDFAGDFIIGQCQSLHSIDYRFPGKSVTGTENLIMAATLAQGTTILRNCALEPEIGDLISFLRCMGASIDVKAEATVIVSGKPSLSGAEYRIIPDRIEAGTYVIAGALPGNDITVSGLIPEHSAALCQSLQAMGVELIIGAESIQIKPQLSLQPCQITTAPYPGFPTDLQAQMTTLLTQVSGVSRIRETIFNARFGHVAQLQRLGANIAITGDMAYITGPSKLHGAVLQTTDLRASAALVLAGLIARGETRIENAVQLLRGYENMAEKLQKIGAHIKISAE